MGTRKKKVNKTIICYRVRSVGLSTDLSVRHVRIWWCTDSVESSSFATKEHHGWAYATGLGGQERSEKLDGKKMLKKKPKANGRVGLHGCGRAATRRRDEWREEYRGGNRERCRRRRRRPRRYERLAYAVSRRPEGCAYTVRRGVRRTARRGPRFPGTPLAGPRLHPGHHRRDARLLFHRHYHIIIIFILMLSSLSWSSSGPDVTRILFCGGQGLK